MCISYDWRGTGWPVVAGPFRALVILYRMSPIFTYEMSNMWATVLQLSNTLGCFRPRTFFLKNGLDWLPLTSSISCLHTVYPKKYAHGFVVLCFVVVMQSFIMNSHEVFIRIHQGCFAGTGAIVRLPQCQWSKPDGYGKISHCITTTKHSKAKTVCIFRGIYCTMLRIISSVAGLATDSPYGVWHRGWITCLLLGGPIFSVKFLNESWCVSLT